MQQATCYNQSNWYTMPAPGRESKMSNSGIAEETMFRQGNIAVAVDRKEQVSTVEAMGTGAP